MSSPPAAPANPTVSEADGQHMLRYSMPIVNEALQHLTETKSCLPTKSFLAAATDFDRKRSNAVLGPTNDALLQLPAWKKLQALAEGKTPTIAELFKQDHDRFKKYSVTLNLGQDPFLPSHAKLPTGAQNSLFLDYSKNWATDEIRAALLQLAHECHVPDRISGMFGGEQINITEKRAVLHTALRNRDPSPAPLVVEGQDVHADVRAVLQKMKGFCAKIHSDEWKGQTGKPIRYVINIGIGGSDLGPMMATEALKPYQKPTITSFFVSNIDSTHMVEAVKKVNLEETLFIVASKTFTTQETLTNAISARDFLLNHFKSTGVSTEGAVAKHFIALSTNTAEVTKFGIDKENMFGFWSWVGGRYSLWSAIGMSIALAIGFDHFEELLEGGYTVDTHFRTAPLEQNVPALLALIGIYNNNFAHCQTYAVLPYDQYLWRLPAYLQQLDMESNGKAASTAGGVVPTSTGPILFGEAGTNGQHAFYQLVHQGTKAVPSDFIGTLETHNPVRDHHQILMSNFFAQTEALMVGKSEDQVRKENAAAYKDDKEGLDAVLLHKRFGGNRPSNSMLVGALTPRALGALIATYEHKIFVQGVVWGINSFDQWGVELGKQLAKVILPELAKPHEEGGTKEKHDGSTAGLISMYKEAHL